MSLCKTLVVTLGSLGVCGIVSGITAKKIEALAKSGESSVILDSINAASGIPNTIAEVVADASSVPLGLSAVLLPISIPLCVMNPRFRQTIGTLTSVYLISACGSMIYKNTKRSISK